MVHDQYITHTHTQIIYSGSRKKLMANKYNDESRMLLSGTVQDLLEEELPTSIEFSNSKTLNENDTSIY